MTQAFVAAPTSKPTISHAECSLAADPATPLTTAGDATHFGGKTDKGSQIAQLGSAEVQSEGGMVKSTLSQTRVTMMWSILHRAHSAGAWFKVSPYGLCSPAT